MTRDLKNNLAAIYWPALKSYADWTESDVVRKWRAASVRSGQPFGWWWEPVSVPADRFETIAFKELLRGVSACPFSQLEPTDATGYWGAARDRIPASGYDTLAGGAEKPTFLDALPDVKDRKVAIRPPRGLTIIRSGVSWEACGEEQLSSFEQNVRPKLDAWHEDILSIIPAGVRMLLAAASRGDRRCRRGDEGRLFARAFLSLHHLETWSRHHPTHLAIYHRAFDGAEEISGAAAAREPTTKSSSSTIRH